MLQRQETHRAGNIYNMTSVCVTRPNFQVGLERKHISSRKYM